MIWDKYLNKFVHGKVMTLLMLLILFLVLLNSNSNGKSHRTHEEKNNMSSIS